MQAGLQTFYADGTVDIDTSTGLPRYLGTTPSLWSGSITVAEWAENRPWFIISGGFVNNPHQVRYTSTSISGTTLSWSTPNPGGSNPQPPVIVYGCY